MHAKQFDAIKCGDLIEFIDHEDGYYRFNKGVVNAKRYDEKGSQRLTVNGDIFLANHLKLLKRYRFIHVRDKYIEQELYTDRRKGE